MGRKVNGQQSTGNDMVSKFLKENKQTVTDNGFTERVMETIPSSRVDWNRVLQVVCYLIVVSTIVFGGGWKMGTDIFDGPTIKDIALNLGQTCLYAMLLVVLVAASVLYNFKDGLGNWLDELGDVLAQFIHTTKQDVGSGI